MSKKFYKRNVDPHARRLLHTHHRLLLEYSSPHDRCTGHGIYQLVMPLQMIVWQFPPRNPHGNLPTVCGQSRPRSKKGPSPLSCRHILSLFLSVILALLRGITTFLAVQILIEGTPHGSSHISGAFLSLKRIAYLCKQLLFFKNHAGFPAFVQLLEQLVRVGSSYLYSVFFLSEGRSLTPLIAVIGTLSGEAASCLVSLFAMGLLFRDAGFLLRDAKNLAAETKPILKMALPSLKPASPESFYPQEKSS